MGHQQTGRMGDEIARGIHGSKSFVGVAFLTLLLYYFGFYVIGLIANMLFLSSAKQTMRITGRSPSGRGCLLFLLWTHLFIPIILIVLLVTIGVGGIMSLVPIGG